MLRLFARRASVLVFSTQTEDLLAGIAGRLGRLGGPRRTLRWDRQAGIHGHDGRPSDGFAAFSGQLKVGTAVLRAGRSSGQGARERLQGYAGTGFEPGRAFANELDRKRSTRADIRRSESARSTALARNWR